jgi:DNA polymerase-3 subunit delta'
VSLAEVAGGRPGVGMALAAAAEAPSHAYLFSGPPGAGKRSAARALAAELLADGASDPDDTRRRAMADPSPHPDLTWVRPPGNQHLVEEIRERVIAAAAYRPFEGERRVFVIEAAEAMAEESQNALLKTLEEPAPFAHLILVTAEPEALLETVRSRCRLVRFPRPAPETLEQELADADASDEERRAAARLADGDLERARFLLSEQGRALRAAAAACVEAARAGKLAAAPWTDLLAAAAAAGEAAGDRVAAAAAEAAEREAGDRPQTARRRAREAGDAARRAGRQARTATLDLGLALIGAHLRDLAAAADGAPELALNADRVPELAKAAEGIDSRRARRAGELVLDTRRRLTVNVGEELALEALLYRVEFLLSG